MPPSNLKKALKEIARITKKKQDRIQLEKDISKNLPQLLEILTKLLKATPKRGVDYFNPTEVKFFLKAATPKKGVDYFDGEDGEDGKDGKDGKPGKDGQDGKDGVANMEEVEQEIKEEIGEHEKKFSHELIHDPKMLGEYELVGSPDVGDFLQVTGDKKIIGAKLPQQKSFPRGSSSTKTNIIRDVTENYTIDKLDDILHVDASSGDVTITIPASAGAEGSAHFIKRVDTSSNDVTFSMTGDDTIDNETLHKLVNFGDGADIYSHNSAWYLRKG